MTTLVIVNFVFLMSLFYSNLIKNLYVQFWGGEKIHPNGCRAYFHLRKWKKNPSGCAYVLRVLYKKFSKGIAYIWGLEVGYRLRSAELSNISFYIVFVQVKLLGKDFYTESFWLELQLFFINWINLDLYGRFTK